MARRLVGVALPWLSMLPVIDLTENALSADAAVARDESDNAEARASVREIIADVRERGDDALCDYTERFDGVRLDAGSLRVSQSELDAALDALDSDTTAALNLAAERIRAYQERELPGPSGEFDRDGVSVSDRIVPVERAGVYVPGGLAAYPSTVLMTVIPAQVAGVGEVALCVPPASDGSLPGLTAAAAALVGVTEVYKVGGAQAIAALAYGTATVAPVDVICGPGNIYVALAKTEVAGTVGVESLAGPSECVIVADDAAAADVVAVDLVAQAEHGPGGFCLLITWSRPLADAVRAEALSLVDESHRGAEITASLETGGRIIVCDGPAQAIELLNAAAPEHAQLMVADPAVLADQITNAGAVFCGYDTPVTLGDYVAGPSHVLPTGGTARFASALRPADFVKSVHFVTATRSGLENVGPAAARLADAEGLGAHALAVRRRLGND